MTLQGAWLLGATVLLVGTTCETDFARRASPVAVVETQARKSMELSVKLRDGFQNDTVSIRVGGAEVYRKSAVSTDLTISFADKVEVPVREDRLSLEVTVDGGPTGSVEVNPGDTPFVDVTIVDGVMTLRPSKTETPMM